MCHTMCHVSLTHNVSLLILVVSKKDTSGLVGHQNTNITCSISLVHIWKTDIPLLKFVSLKFGSNNVFMPGQPVSLGLYSQTSS